MSAWILLRGPLLLCVTAVILLLPYLSVLCSWSVVFPILLVTCSLGVCCHDLYTVVHAWLVEASDEIILDDFMQKWMGSASMESISWMATLWGNALLYSVPSLTTPHQRAQLFALTLCLSDDEDINNNNNDNQDRSMTETTTTTTTTTMMMRMMSRHMQEAEQVLHQPGGWKRLLPRSAQSWLQKHPNNNTSSSTGRTTTTTKLLLPAPTSSSSSSSSPASDITTTTDVTSNGNSIKNDNRSTSATTTTTVARPLGVGGASKSTIAPQNPNTQSRSIKLSSTKPNDSCMHDNEDENNQKGNNLPPAATGTTSNDSKSSTGGRTLSSQRPAPPPATTPKPHPNRSTRPSPTVAPTTSVSNLFMSTLQEIATDRVLTLTRTYILPALQQKTPWLLSLVASPTCLATTSASAILALLVQAKYSPRARQLWWTLLQMTAMASGTLVAAGTGGLYLLVLLQAAGRNHETVHDSADTAVASNSSSTNQQRRRAPRGSNLQDKQQSAATSPSPAPPSILGSLWPYLEELQRRTHLDDKWKKWALAVAIALVMSKSMRSMTPQPRQLRQKR